MDINEKLHKIYDECRALDREYNGFISGELIEEIKTDEERRFAVHISNFFLADIGIWTKTKTKEEIYDFCRCKWCG